MASTPLFLFLFTIFFFFFTHQTLAQNETDPFLSVHLNLTDVLVQGGQYNTINALMNETGLNIQLESQLNNIGQGLTLFAPTDSAFNKLKPGALSGLSEQKKKQLLLYHIAPQFYTLTQLLTVSNWVSIGANDSNGFLDLNLTVGGEEVNISLLIKNTVRQVAPLAVYQLDRLLSPEALFDNKLTTSSSPPPQATSTSGSTNETETAASSPSNGTGAGVRNKIGVRLVFGIGSINLLVMSISYT